MKTWTIKSTSDQSKTYQVVYTDTKEWKCTCVGFISHKKDCKHIKGLKKAYEKRNNKQIAKSQPAPIERQGAEVQSDNRGLGEERNTIPSGELRRGDSVDGNPADIHEGIELNGGNGHDDQSGQNAEASVGTPNVSTDLSGPTEGSDQTTPTINSGVCDENDAREQLRLKREAQLKQYEEWELRETEFSAELHKRLRELRLQYKNETDKEKRRTITLMSGPLKTAIRMANRRDFKSKPNFDIGLIDVPVDQLTDESVKQLEDIQEVLF